METLLPEWAPEEIVGSLEDAACQDADPSLFDATRYPHAFSALAFCRRCTATEECLALVKPSRSFFDGVAGGVVWRNGYKVRGNNRTRERTDFGDFADLSKMDGLGALHDDGSGRFLPGIDKSSLASHAGAEGNMRVLPEQDALW